MKWQFFLFFFHLLTFFTQIHFNIIRHLKCHNLISCNLSLAQISLHTHTQFHTMPIVFDQKNLKITFYKGLKIKKHTSFVREKNWEFEHNILMDFTQLNYYPTFCSRLALNKRATRQQGVRRIENSRFSFWKKK
jgi:hypothetical protein